VTWQACRYLIYLSGKQPVSYTDAAAHSHYNNIYHEGLLLGCEKILLVSQAKHCATTSVVVVVVVAVNKEM